ncbi:MAG: aminotransferase class III-fold pyridoxal phosphate-dependent enzyme [Eubacterium sp.]|nr:aminotransferase class III-fold pyridoxal phosphate-dependent enzyme [Eubacterium sp.]
MSKELIEKAKQYTMFSFTGQTQREYQPFYMKKAEGIHVWDDDGNEYIDLASQLVNVNIGFGNRAVIDAIKEQAETLAYAAPKHQYDRRGELGELIVQRAPANMGKVLFTLGGSDANEFAIRIAKAYTGKDKFFSKYESYHGGTYGASTLTGEPDRASLFPGIPGFVKYQPAHLYSYDIRFSDEDEATAHFLNRLEYQIQMEDPDKIAGLFIETVPGSNGVYVYPRGYLKGVRELCTKYKILMICDEVMAGFLRSGDWFAIQREAVEPDIITFAKGVNSSYAPLGGVIISKEIASYYDNNPFTAGLTYNAHPLGVAAAIACIHEYERLKIREHVLELEPYLKEKLAWLAERHPSIGDVRSTGLFGAVEFSWSREKREVIETDADGSSFLQNFIVELRRHGLLSFGGGSHILVAPPLIITKEELDEAFDRLDRAVVYADRLVESRRRQER